MVAFLRAKHEGPRDYGRMGTREADIYPGLFCIQVGTSRRTTISGTTQEGLGVTDETDTPLVFKKKSCILTLLIPFFFSNSATRIERKP